MVIDGEEGDEGRYVETLRMRSGRFIVSRF